MPKVNQLNAGKELHIKFLEIGKEPEFKFVGNWIGSDVRVIMNLMTRAYRHYTATKRVVDTRPQSAPRPESEQPAKV